MKRFKKFICISALVLFILGISVQAFAVSQEPASQTLLTTSPTTNLAINGDFELNNGKVLFPWSPSYFASLGKVTYDSKVVHSGKFSVLIDNPKDDHSRITQKIKVEPNSTYRFAVWVKSENVAPAASQNVSPVPDFMFGANMTIDKFSNSYSNSIKGAQDWKLLEMYKKTDAVTTEIPFQLALGGYGSTVSGKVWYDDLVIEKVSTVPAGAKVDNISPDSSDNSPAASNDLFTVIMVILVILIVVGSIGGYLVYISRKNDKKMSTKTSTNPQKGKIANQQINDSTPLPPQKTKITIRDLIIMGVCTLLYAILAFSILGSLSVPEKGWTSQTTGDSFVLELPKEITTSRAGLYLGYGNAMYQIDYLAKDGNYQKFTSAPYDKKEGELFKWIYLDSSTVTTNKFKITVEGVGGTYTEGLHNGTLNEIAFFTTNPTTNVYEQIDITGSKITDVNLIDSSEGKDKQDFAALVDEQNKVSAYKTYYNSTYFDEIYHARTAYENVHNLPVYETTHPPLGKLIISMGIRIFGMNPFGWRFSGALFGVFLLPLMYLFAMKLFRRRFLAFAAMWFMSVDFMHFSLSRISTIDIFGTFFVLLMYYFIYDYFVDKSINIGYKKSLVPLLLTGIAFGLGAASKWICIYAAAGLALLFFLTKYQEYKQFTKITAKWKSSRTGWVKDFVPLYMTRTIMWSCAFFIAIPLIIYVSSYFPSYLNVPGSNFKQVIQNQTSMYNYHTGLTNKEDRASRWYEWPLLTKPLYVSGGEPVQEGSNYTASIHILGNPAIFWLGIIFVPFAVYMAIKRRNRGMTVVFIAFLFQYIPWIFVSRITYIYHIFSCLPFIIFSIIYVFSCLLENKSIRLNEKINIRSDYLIIIAYLILCTGLFILFYPILSGITVQKTYYEMLNWFKNSTFMKWNFF